MKKVYAKFLTMLTVMSLAPAGAAMAADPAELPVEFDLGSSISISLSSSSLKITDLLPGEQKNSNVVTVRVSTNNESGYTLSATVGSSENESKNLVNINTTDKFAMVSGENQALGDSTWGYSLGGASATTFSTLPLYTEETMKVLRESSGPAADDVPFVIGARAKSGMSAGGYTNVINFVAVTKAAKEYMQNFSCDTLNKGDTVTLYDKRDEEAYLVGKLNDGKCWMLDNLRLGDANGISITSENSDLNGGITSFTIPSNKAYSATGSSWSGSMTTPEFAYYTSSTDSGNYGNYYNWPAAVAGSVVNSGNASSSICPKGWKLPTGGSSGELKALYTAYSSNATNFFNATHFVFSGSYYYGVESQGYYGYWWSSTANGSDDAYDLSGGSDGDVYPGNNYRKDFGISVRCVAGS